MIYLFFIKSFLEIQGYNVKTFSRFKKKLCYIVLFCAIQWYLGFCLQMSDFRDQLYITSQKWSVSFSDISLK